MAIARTIIISDMRQSICSTPTNRLPLLLKTPTPAPAAAHHQTNRLGETVASIQPLPNCHTFSNFIPNPHALPTSFLLSCLLRHTFSAYLLSFFKRPPSPIIYMPLCITYFPF